MQNANESWGHWLFHRSRVHLWAAFKHCQTWCRWWLGSYPVALFISGVMSFHCEWGTHDEFNQRIKFTRVGDPNRRKRSVFSPWSSISSQYTCLIIKWDKTDRFPYSTNLTELPFSTSAALGHFPSTRVGPTSLGKVPEESPTGLCGSLYYSFSSGSEGWQSVWSHLFYFSCQKVYQLVWIIEIGFFLGRCGDDFIEYNPNIKISDYLLTEVFWILNSFPRPQKKRIQQSHPPPSKI